MPTEQMPQSNPGTDIKHVVLILLVLAAVVVSSVNLALSLSEDRNEVYSPAVNNLDTQVTEATPQTEVVEEATAPEEDALQTALAKTASGALIGAAELEGRWRTVERPTNLDPEGEKVQCQGFEITNGPELLLNHLENDVGSSVVPSVNGHPTIIVGDLTNLRDGSAGKMLLMVDSRYVGGEVVGCTPYPNTGSLIY